MKVFNTVICGVGGSGVIGLGKLLKNIGLPHGYTVVGSETRGSAQRGGAVTSSIRYIMNNNDHSGKNYNTYLPPNIPVGQADVIIATESSEVLRQAIYLNRNTKVLINRFYSIPKPDRKSLKNGGEIGYPDSSEIFENISKLAHFVRFVEASETSLEMFGHYVMTNYILLGVAIKTTGLPIEHDILMDFISNQQAKDAVLKGYELAEN
jgi:indolepyruvate ferredoxin oxidoreductase beta subunit